MSKDTITLIKDIILVVTPLFIGLWGGIKYLIDKGIINKDFFKRNKVEYLDLTPKLQKRRDLTIEEVAVLRNHPLFSDLQAILHHQLEEIYNRSKKKLPQLLFVTQLQYVFVVHLADCLTALDRVEKNLDAPKNLVIKTLLGTIVNSKENVEALIKEKGIKMSISNKFNTWYNEHFSWYFPMIELLTLDATDYYKELDNFLNLTRAFVRAVQKSAENHIDIFNGEIMSEVIDDDLSTLDFGMFKNHFEYLINKK